MAGVELDEWLKESVARNAPNMKASKIYAGLVGDGFLKDPNCALQLGLAILMDKPIILIVDRKTKLPESLVKVAKAIEYVDSLDRGDVPKIADRIKRFAEEVP